MTMPGERAIDVRGITFSYPASRRAERRRALADVTFDVPAGRVVGLLGRNGGGKSTLLKILATILRPDEGAARILGHDVVSDAAAVRASIGVLFQSPSIDTRLTVRENLLHAGHLYGLRGATLRADIDAMLARVELAAQAGTIADRLSGGMRRRVEIAKSLLHRPRVLLLDEPSTGLDPAVRREVWRLLRELRAAFGVTILVTTHIMQEAEECERLLLIDRGRLVVDGTPDDLKARIGGDVITATGPEPAAIAAVLAERFDLRAAAVDGSIRVEVRNGHDLIPRIVEALGGRVQSITLSKPTLEDVFVHFAGRRLTEDEVPMDVEEAPLT